MKQIIFLLFLIFAYSSFAGSSTYIKGPMLVKSTTVNSGAAAVTLTATSNMVQVFTGTVSHDVKLPVISSIPEGFGFEFSNLSTGTLRVFDSSDVLLQTIQAKKRSFFVLASGAWSYTDEAGYSLSNPGAFAGSIVTPSVTDNGSGNVTITATTLRLFDNATFDGVAKDYTGIPPLTVTLADGVTSYAVGDYNSGSPIIRITTDVNEITESSIIPLFTLFRSGNVIHTMDWDLLGKGLANKTHQSIVKTQRYRRESGLAISESGTRNVNLSSGIIWTGANRVSLSSIASSTDNMYYYLRTATSSWTVQPVTQYNNSDFFNGTTTASLTNNRFAVSWLYRGVESQKHLYTVIGEGDYTLAQAQASQPPSSLPASITSHAVLVGRIIVLKGASVATQIDSAFNVVFTQAATSVHNDLSGLQGGAAGEYYHLNQAKYNAAQNLTASGTMTLFTGDTQTATGNCTYFGDSMTDGSHRSCQVGGALIYSKRVSGSWSETFRVE